MSLQKQKLEFVLFLDPSDGHFYSYCASRGLLVEQQNVPHSMQNQAQKQIQDLKTCLGIQNIKEELISTQKRPVPLSFLSQRKFKYPVYFTEQYLSASSLERIKVNQGGKAVKDNLSDTIKIRIYLNQLQKQLQHQSPKSKRGGLPPTDVSLTVKLIASVNEVIRTLNRVILQDQGVVVTMESPTNKLIFKVRDKNQYLYGNESLANFQIVRECLKNDTQLQLDTFELPIYDKQQHQHFRFYRSALEKRQENYSQFPWQQFLKKRKDDLQFLMWQPPENYFKHPETLVEEGKLFSVDELVRNNEKIKLKKQEQQRMKIKRVPRFLWKQKTLDFLERRKKQIKGRYIDLESNIIFSGECFFAFHLEVKSCNNIFFLFDGIRPENKVVRKKFLKFKTKDLINQSVGQAKLPSVVTRTLSFAALRKDNNKLDIIPYMLNVSVQFTLGPQILHSTQTECVLADNHQNIQHKIEWKTIAKLPLETNAVFKLIIYEKQGNGVVVGVGALKLFDQYGFLLQGQQEVQLYKKEKMQMLRIGCVDNEFTSEPNTPKLVVKLPKFKQNVLWSLTDPTCAKLMGYHPPQLLNTSTKEENNLQRLNELLRYNPLQIRKYKEKDKQLLRKNKKYYKHQSDKLINYLFSIDWNEPAQVAEAYSTIPEWTPLKPTEALFLLNPNIVDEKVRYYAVKRMQHFMDHEFVLYSNQITQALVSFQTHNNALIELIIQRCVQEPFSMGVQYFWQFKNKIEEEFSQNRFRLYLQELCMVTNFRKELAHQIQVNKYLIKMNQTLINNTSHLKEYKEKNTEFVQMLPTVQAQLNQICQSGFLFPIRPQYTFTSIRKNECKMFDSKKLPFCLSCVPRPNYQGKSYKVMFKYGDDLKQDHLILQMFKIFDKLWRENGLDLKMNIYRTLSTGNEVGFIEIVEAESNHKIHCDFGKGISQAFDERATLLYLENCSKKAAQRQRQRLLEQQRKNPSLSKGKEKEREEEPPDEKTYLGIAKYNYLHSSAAYLVATYILGIGDRHSGNVMVQENGKFFHIDFGHILGNFKEKMGIKRQRSPMLFVSEFVEVMGGKDSAEYGRFQSLCAQAFNIIRKNAFLIINMLVMMVSAEIPQLRKIQDLEYVAEKMALDLSDAQAAEKLINTIKETLLSQKSRNLDNFFHEVIHEG